jgi:hypothetical protein
MSLSTVNTRKLVAGSVWLTFIFFLAYSLVLVFSQSPNIAGVENNTVYFIQQLLDGSSLYTNPAQPPYAIAQYGPLYYQLVAGIGKIAGLSADDVMGVFVLSRVVSIVLFLLTAFFAYLVSRKIFLFSRHRSWLLFAVVFIFFELSSFARADSLANSVYFFSLFLFLAGLKKAGSGKGSIALVLAAALAGLAFFSKQSSLTLPAICGLYLLLVKQYRSFFYYTASFVIVLVAGLLLIHFTAGIDVFYQNVGNGVDNGFDISTYLGYIIREFLGQKGLLWLVLMLVTGMVMAKKKDSLSRFLALLMLLQFIFSLILALKKGSSSNYFTEWWIIVLIATAWCWDEFSGILSGIDNRLPAVLIIVILFFRATFIIYPFYEQVQPGYRANANKKYAEEKAVALFIREKMMGKSQRVYNNIFSPDTYLNSLLFREAIMPQHDVVVFGTYYRDVYDYSLFRKQIEEGTIAYIVDKPGEQEAVKLKIDMSNYKEIAAMGGYHIYESTTLVNQ